ncbi:MAG: hypothetical protein R2848_14395 [Thermomicrobiales bacterium]
MSVSVTIYTCSSGYSGGDPGSDGNCGPAAGVGVSASSEGGPIGASTTNGSGVASFDAPEGETVTFTEDQSTLPSGFVPDGNGSASVAASDGASAYDRQYPGEHGRADFRSPNGQCPTSGEARTQFIVVGPLAMQAAGLGCQSRVPARASPLLARVERIRSSLMALAIGLGRFRLVPTPFSTQTDPLISRLWLEQRRSSWLSTMYLAPRAH